ncbi:MAG: ImmA/IrrE family metallo-endopeptidase [Planctomycetota bacterium]
MLESASKTEFAEKMFRETGEPLLDDAITAFVERRCGDHLTERGYELRKVAGDLGVIEIFDSEMAEDGALDPIDDKHYVMYLNRWASDARRRFTMAHELGHALLHQLVPASRRFETRSLFLSVGADGEERLCDALAAELLMPRQQFCAAAEGQPFGIGLVGRLAQQFRTSITATMRRYCEVVDCDLACVLCRFVLDVDQSLLHNQTMYRRHLKDLSAARLAAPEIVAFAQHGNRSGFHGVHWLRQFNTRRELFVDVKPVSNRNCLVLATGVSAAA